MTPVSVNVSRLNFYNHGLLDFLTELLRRYELEAWMIQLEVTEQSYTENQKQIAQAIGEFRERGFIVIMDNFGSGTSSLRVLKDLPVDVVKLDMRFLKGGNEDRARAILKGVVQTVRAIETDFVVEGVETDEQVAYLETIGCDRMQGYHFARPMPQAAFWKLLKEEENGKA